MKDQHRVCPLRESLHVRSCLALPWFTSSLCGFQSSADPAKCAAFPALLLVIWTRKQWRRWPSHAHKVTVARLQARHQCCSTSPRHFLSFPSGRKASWQGHRVGALGARSMSSSGARPLPGASSERSASGGQRVSTCPPCANTCQSCEA